MIAVDTNILVYAHRADSPWYEAAYRLIADVAQGDMLWGVPWPCIHEFLAVATHPRIYNPPTPLAKAIEQIEIWMESPSIRILAEMAGHWKELKEIITAGQIAGGAIHDARVAAICVEHGVREMWSADRNFTRIPGVIVRNPLIG